MENYNLGHRGRTNDALSQQVNPADQNDEYSFYGNPNKTSELRAKTYANLDALGTMFGSLFGEDRGKPKSRIAKPSAISTEATLKKTNSNPVNNFLGDGRTNPVGDARSTISVGEGKGSIDLGSQGLNDKYQSKINNSKGTLNTISLKNTGQFQLGERIKSIGARQRAGEISVEQAQEEIRMAKSAFSNLGQPESQGNYQESSFPDPRQNLLATILSTKGGKRRAAIKAYELANKQFGDLAQRGADSSQSQNQLNAAGSLNKQRAELAKQKLAQEKGFSNKEYALKERESGRADEELGLKVKDNYFENFVTQLQGADPAEQTQLIDALLLDREANEY